MRRKKFNVSALLGWFARNARDLPWRRRRDPYGVWVSEIMLQQTQVKTVLPYWERWMEALPTIAALARMPLPKVHKLWEGLGYYRRADNLRRTAQLIMENHGGQFPHRYEDVLALPGIGRYTAGAICSIAFNQPTPILDGNVIRVLTRWFGIEGPPRHGPTNAKLWSIAGELVQEAGKEASAFNQSLMELGALCCTARQPQCAACPIAKGCTARQQGRVTELPNLGPRPPATPRRFAAFVACRGGRFLVRQRPTGLVNGGLWEFPNVEVSLGVEHFEPIASHALGVTHADLQPLCTIRHSITRYRITLEVFRVALHSARKLPSLNLLRSDSAPSLNPGQWLTLRHLRQLPFAAAHKKILQCMEAET
ncbi:A/G-specific adenine glycosylase [Verrucomicrobia bacterium]|nr:A/G-specific adenine glycosylase [Verrucomicrobiota bacterium]